MTAFDFSTQMGIAERVLDRKRFGFLKVEDTKKSVLKSTIKVFQGEKQWERKTLSSNKYIHPDVPLGSRC